MASLVVVLLGLCQSVVGAVEVGIVCVVGTVEGSIIGCVDKAVVGTFRQAINVTFDDGVDLNFQSILFLYGQPVILLLMELLLWRVKVPELARLAGLASCLLD